MDTSQLKNQNIVNPLFKNPMESCHVPFWAIRGSQHKVGLEPGVEPKEGRGKGDVAFFVYGRYQPGHKGHQVVFNKLIEEAKNFKKKLGAEKALWIDQNKEPASNIFVFTSPKQNPPPLSLTDGRFKKKCSKGDTKAARCENPLAPDPKVELLKQQNPPTKPDGSKPFINFINMDKNFISKKIINEALSDLESIPKKKVFEYKKIRTPVAAVALLFRCYKKVIMYVGSDRVDAMRGFLQKTFADKTLGGRLSIESAGERDPDSEGIEGMSSSKIRQAAVNIKKIGDANYNIVKENIQIGDVDDDFTEDIIDYIRDAYNVKDDWVYAGETFESDTEGGGKKRKTRKRKLGRKKKTLKRKTKLRKTQKRKRRQKRTKNSKRR